MPITNSNHLIYIQLNYNFLLPNELVASFFIKEFFFYVIWENLEVAPK